MNLDKSYSNKIFIKFKEKYLLFTPQNFEAETQLKKKKTFVYIKHIFIFFAKSWKKVIFPFCLKSMYKNETETNQLEITRTNNCYI